MSRRDEPSSPAPEEKPDAPETDGAPDDTTELLPALEKIAEGPDNLRARRAAFWRRRGTTDRP
jgi:hypothetical protein